jgi:hypothetical protein
MSIQLFKPRSRSVVHASQRLANLRQHLEGEVGDLIDVEVSPLAVLHDVCLWLRLPPDQQRKVLGKYYYGALLD